MSAKQISQIFRRKAGKPKGDKLIVFLICLGLSAFFWLLNSLEKRYTDRISVPVKYINLPKDKQISGSLPKKLDLIVDGYGYTLLNHKLRLAFSPVLINVTDLTDKIIEGKKESRYTIYTSAHKEEIEKQISSEIKILNIKPDTISFNLNYVIDKKVRIKPHLGLTFGKEFIIQSDPVVTPDSVWIRGPQNLIDTLQFIQTKYETLKEVTHNISKTIPLEPIEGVQYATRKVEVVVNVEQNTEAIFEIPIETINLPDTIEIKTFPGKTKVYCKVGLSKYKSLSSSNFKAIVDFKNAIETPAKLPVTLINYPENILSIHYIPQEVEYILEKSNR